MQTRLVQGDTRSLDYSSYGIPCFFGRGLVCRRTSVIPRHTRFKGLKGLGFKGLRVSCSKGLGFHV